MDDIIFWESDTSFARAWERMNQKCHFVEKWLNENQMRLNEIKSKLLVNKMPAAVPFLKLQGCHYFPQNKLRYLGINLISHEDGPDFAIDLRDVKPDLKRRCSLLYKVSKWIPSHSCLMFAKSIVLGKLNFYLPFLGAENKQTLDPLIKGLNEAMRMITGGFCTTPIPLLHARSGIPPLDILIKHAAGNVWCSLKFQPNCLTKDYESWDASGDNGCSPLSALWEFEYNYIHQFYPRKEDESLFEVEASDKVTESQSEALMQCNFNYIDMSKERAECLYDNNQIDLPCNHALWTDGSKRDAYGSTGVVWVTDQHTPPVCISRKYFPIFSSFQVEINAIRDGLDYICSHVPDNYPEINVLTDSQSALKHLKSLSLRPWIVSECVYSLIESIETYFARGMSSLNFYWIPGHKGISYNEKADKIAKHGLEASDEVVVNQHIPRKRLEHFNRCLRKKRFKQYLKENVQRSHWQMYPKRDYFRKIRDYVRGSNRNLDIFLFRMRSGHNKLGRHLFNVKMKDDSHCRLCAAATEDSYHLLMECPEILRSNASEQIISLRQRLGSLTRNQFHSWIYSETEVSQVQQRTFMEALSLIEIEL